MPNFSTWLGIKMIEVPGSGVFDSDPNSSAILEEIVYKRKNQYWQASIRVGNYAVTGSDFIRSKARQEAEDKFKNLVRPVSKILDQINSSDKMAVVEVWYNGEKVTLYDKIRFDTNLEEIITFANEAIQNIKRPNPLPNFWAFVVEKHQINKGFGLKHNLIRIRPPTPF